MKLPVFKAFGSTFAFVIEHIGDLIRILWLPTAILLAADWWFWRKCFDSILGLTQLGSKPTPQEVMALISPMATPLAVVLLAALICMPMIYAGPLRFLIRGEKPSLPFYLRFGADEGRLLGTYIVVVLINIGIAIGFGIVNVIAVLALGGPHAASAGLAGGLVSLVRFFVTVWVSLRLSLAYAAAVGVGGVGVSPSWSVTKGNSWHLFGYWLLWIFLFVIVTAVIVVPFVPGIVSFFQDLHVAAGNPDQVREVFRKMLLALHERMHGFGTGTLIFLVGGYVFSVIYNALLVCAGGVAYRLIKER